MNRRRGDAERMDLAAQQRQFFAANRQNRRLQRTNAAMEERSLLVPADPPLVLDDPNHDSGRPSDCPPEQPYPTPVTQRVRSEREFLKQLQTSEASRAPIPLLRRSNIPKSLRPQPPLRHISKPRRIEKKRLQRFDPDLQLLQTRRDFGDIAGQILPNKRRRRHSNRMQMNQHASTGTSEAVQTHARHRDVLPIEQKDGDDIIIFDENEDKTRFYRRPLLSPGFFNSERTRPDSNQNYATHWDAFDRLKYHPSKPPSPSFALNSDRHLADPSFSHPLSKSSTSERSSKCHETASRIRHELLYGENVSLSQKSGTTSSHHSPESQVPIHNSSPKEDVNEHFFSLTNSYFNSPLCKTTNQEAHQCSNNEKSIPMQAPSTRQLQKSSENLNMSHLLGRSKEDRQLDRSPMLQLFNRSPSPELPSLLLPNRPYTIFPEINFRPESPLYRPESSFDRASSKSYSTILVRLPWNEDKRSAELMHFEKSLLKPDKSVALFALKITKTPSSSDAGNKAHKVKGSQDESEIRERNESINIERNCKTKREAGSGLESTTCVPLKVNLSAVDIEMPQVRSNPIMEAFLNSCDKKY